MADKTPTASSSSALCGPVVPPLDDARPPQWPASLTPELLRSPASRVVGQLAAYSGLGASHFEHRLILPTPEHWLPEGRPDLGDPPSWSGGVLPEPKYQAFRHDCLVGSFHPGHRAKWTGHELCHALVGFAWRPDGGPLFNALAARAAEVLPVALWYFFDEAGLRRCAEHADGGPLFGAFCADCERTAREPGVVTGTSQWFDEGQRWVQRELDAIRTSLRTGRPTTHRWATLDLGSDGLAYAAMHHERLASEEHALWVDWFSGPDRGWHASMEAFLQRIEALMGALVSGEADPALAWSVTPSEWAAQDVGARLLQVASETDGDARDELLDLVDALAANQTDAGLIRASEAYAALLADFDMPARDDVFAVGYDLPGGLGHSVSQLERGVRSALPRTAELLGDGFIDTVREFAREDAWVREGIGRRFARWLGDAAGPGVRDSARLEAALAHPAPADPLAASLNVGIRARRDATYLVSSAVEVLDFDWDVLAWLDGEAAESEDSGASAIRLAIFRRADGEVGIVPLEPSVPLPQAPTARDALGLDPDTVTALLHHGVLVPTRWDVPGDDSAR